LVGFFLQIGIGGLPDANALLFALLFALVMALVLPLKGVLFFFLFLFFKLRARSAFLSGLSLTNYSEFGLIVASVVLPEWLIPLAVTVAVSFVISAPLKELPTHFTSAWQIVYCRLSGISTTRTNNRYRCKMPRC